MASTDKYRARRNRARVHELFWREWDPIGVNHAPEAIDEYDRYADQAYVMLMSEGRSANEIAEYLYYISSEYMGLNESQRLKDLAVGTAEKLARFGPASMPSRMNRSDFSGGPANARARVSDCSTPERWAPASAGVGTSSTLSIPAKAGTHAGRKLR
jgi:hypothetical protein